MPSRNGLDLDTGERLHYRGDLRSGEEIAVTDSRLLVRKRDETTSVPYTNVSEVSNESFNWFLAILSLSLVAFGVYSIPENAFAGVGLAAFGCWSIYRTYRHRDRVRIHTHSQPKPVEVFPADAEALYDELEPAIETVRAEQEAKRERELKGGEEGVAEGEREPQ
ncbi:hypothetical protein [Natronorubrum halalkaliphilum]|uniref:hypothetical protein n=1 Tax=Natronorubrum halalkaliphilum TaxID=2691917 RepID=UPI0019158A00|nr:hypothetical protein [Natronorubrum halalkaliphilum]